MRHYIYRLAIYIELQDPEFGKIQRRIKFFLGNDEAELMEKFEMWAIKSGTDRAEMILHLENVQHANN